MLAWLAVHPDKVLTITSCGHLWGLMLAWLAVHPIVLTITSRGTFACLCFRGDAKDLGCPMWLFYLNTLWSIPCHGVNATCLWIYMQEASVSEVGVSKSFPWYVGRGFRELIWFRGSRATDVPSIRWLVVHLMS